MFQNVKRITVTEQIMNQIVEFIRSGKVTIGDRLPTERELAEQFGVARARVREALRALSLIGMVTIRAGEGSFVSMLDMPILPDTVTRLFETELENLQEIFDARVLIESEVYRTAARKITPENFDILARLLVQLSDARSHRDSEGYLTLLDQFDLYIAEISQHKVYLKLMQTVIHLRKEAIRRFLKVPGAIEKSVETRFVLVNAMKSGDPQQVTAAINQHFKTAQEFNDVIEGKWG
jgi:DNA-binding FadR family transcriptional regulator